MSLTKKILDWNEKEFEKIDETKDKHPYLKALRTGVINGFIDGAVFAYPILLACCYYWRKKAEKK